MTRTDGTGMGERLVAICAEVGGDELRGGGQHLRAKIAGFH